MRDREDGVGLEEGGGSSGSLVSDAPELRHEPLCGWGEGELPFVRSGSYSSRRLAVELAKPREAEGLLGRLREVLCDLSLRSADARQAIASAERSPSL